MIHVFTLTSFLKLLFPGTLEITSDRVSEHNAERTQSMINVKIVGISPEIWNVAGRFSIAGPVKELTVIAIDPSIPIIPLVDFCEVKTCT